MKKRLQLIVSWPVFFILATILFITLPSCQDEVKSTFTYRASIPVFLEMHSIREADIIIQPSPGLDDPGKIYLYGDFLFINEPQKGIHIWDNANPSNPSPISFIPIPGNVDLAINSEMLYADSYVDLLVFDISDIFNISLVKRVEDVFEQMYIDRSTATIITYKDTVITTESEVAPWGRGWSWVLAFSDASSGNRGAAASQSYGQGGSMARFTLLNAHLYAVDESSLRVFDVIKTDDPQHVRNINLGWGIETIFPFQDKLFIGSNTGMYIYDASVASEPKEMAVYQHVTACDPVVVNEKYAFVTLRTGRMCPMGVDELQVIDIQNPYSPKLLKAYPMLNPHGLALSGDYLYVAEGKHGMKSFLVADVLAIDQNQLEFLKSMPSVDMIPGPKSLIVIGADGVCQFDYSTPDALKPLSCIKVKKTVIV